MANGCIIYSVAIYIDIFILYYISRFNVNVVTIGSRLRTGMSVAGWSTARATTSPALDTQRRFSIKDSASSGNSIKSSAADGPG